jgi:hypothetical protein
MFILMWVVCFWLRRDKQVDFNIFTPIVCPHVPRKRSPLMGDRRGLMYRGVTGQSPVPKKDFKNFDFIKFGTTKARLKVEDDIAKLSLDSLIHFRD